MYQIIYCEDVFIVWCKISQEIYKPFADEIPVNYCTFLKYDIMVIHQRDSDSSRCIIVSP
jgi:hypothetical protein